MAQPQILINQAGPLPITVTVPAPGVGPATLVVAGSVWTGTPNKLIGVEVQFDGASIGQAVIWSNGPTTHRAVVPMHLPVELDKQWEGDPPQPPDYTVTLTPLNDETNSDVNDWYQVALLA